MYLVPSLVLLLLLAIASWQDWHEYHIQNNIILSGMLLGVLLNTTLPTSIGTIDALSGCGIGLLLLLPFYMARIMGAGDVKLMAMVGAFIGPTDILGVFVSTLIVGGILAVIVSLRQGTLRKLIDNLRYIFLDTLLTQQYHPRSVNVTISENSSGKIPYAIAIAIGTIAHLILQQRIF